MKISLLICTLLFCFGCYRMPEEGEVSMVPNVNNPKFGSKNNPQGVVTPSFDY